MPRSVPKGSTQPLFRGWRYTLPDEVLNHRAALKAGILKPAWDKMAAGERLAAKEAALKSLRPKKLRWQPHKGRPEELVARKNRCELRIYRSCASRPAYFIYARVNSARGLEVIGTAETVGEAKRLAEDYVK